jgi:hypothetical protein
MSDSSPIYESVVARIKGGPWTFWCRVMTSGARLSLVWLVVIGGVAALLLIGKSEPKLSAGRAVACVAAASLFGMAMGMLIEASGREVYLHSSGLAIRQTAYRRLRTYSREGLSIRRYSAHGGFDRVEIHMYTAQEPAAVLWIKQQDADRLQAWLNGAEGSKPSA